MADAEQTTWRLQSTNGYSFLMGILVSEADGGPVHELMLETRLPDEAEPAAAIATMPLSRLRPAKFDRVAERMAGPARSAPSPPIRSKTAIDLALQRRRSLKRTFGSSDDVITTRGQVVCRSDLRQQLFEASMTFAPDPTSLESPLDGLKQLRS